MAILFGAPVFMPGDRPTGPAEAHGSQSTDYVALAAKHVAKGYSAGYAPKPPPGDHVSVRAARAAFREAGVRIAEVGCWTNLLADDDELRSTNFTLIEDVLYPTSPFDGCAVAVPADQWAPLSSHPASP